MVEVLEGISCRPEVKMWELPPVYSSAWLYTYGIGNGFLSSSPKKKKKKKKISSPFSPLSRRGLNPIKPVMTQIGRMASLISTASAFNQLGQYTSSPGRRGYCYTQNSPFSSLAVAVTIASTHCAYPQRGGQAELAWMAAYVVRQFTCPKAITHPTTNRAQCSADALIETNALQLH